MNSLKRIRKMPVMKKLLGTLIGLSIPVITILDLGSRSGNRQFHSICVELHYIPLLIAGLVFGLRGALITSLAVSLLYGLYMVLDWRGASLWFLDNSIHIIFPVIFSILIGSLVNMRNNSRRHLERNRYLSGLGQSAAILVHDLKNPLLTARAAIRRLEKGKSSLELALAAFNEAMEKMEQIMNGVLDFSKPLQMNQKEVEAASLLKELLASCSAKAEADGVTLSMSGQDGPVVLMVDPVLMQRALVNLVNNAIEASIIGQAVSVRLLKTDGMAVIKIRDHGEGMDKQTLKNLFIPFCSKKNNGTGLGMAVAKKIVEEHNGRIGVKSRPSAGTKITVLLPLTNPYGSG
jgi:signal transduction histidine kinase